ncbi:glycerol uptake facilitator-like aquaporin [Caulobacter ginsengisoli]|uniref:Glycerol uptake facilitator-like aquaporin n=1 Tax=Caulobacter ginsengisoli TaxID=400775 RepID=A0ABU0IVV0_9CAUL|nr:MIP/aquaporin family protein [Caulobacter ginsengisoli]MDQ0466152.1 glycerol uptake facilitator-like aquaporin [Caulobacter ginsengisoli]
MPVEPPPFGPLRRLTAEFLGSLLLAAVVIGSGVMGQTLAGGNVAIALMGNTLATGAGLVVLIVVFGPISGAHFNPAVSLVAALNCELTWREAGLYALAQIAGCIAGAWTAHLMFGLPVIQVSTHLREGPAQMFSEAVATFGLVATILASVRLRPALTPACVGLYITAAYWFTASTSFANPAITLARSLSDSFAGIAPHSIPAFLLGQVIGALTAWALFGWLLKPARPATP